MGMRRVHRRAGELLAERGNRLLLIEAIAVLLLFAVMYSSFSYACAALLFLAPEDRALLIGATAVHALGTLLLTVMLVVPTFLGVCRIAYKMTRSERVVLADMFCAFSDRRNYRRTVSAARGFLLRAAAVWIACEVTYLLFVYLIPPLDGIELLCGLLIGIEVLCGVAILLRGYPMLYVMLQNGEAPLSEVRRQAQTQPSVFRGGRFFIFFLPSIVLGFFTVGILWIADTLPRMLVAYFVDCEAADQDGIGG